MSEIDYESIAKENHRKCTDAYVEILQLKKKIERLSLENEVLKMKNGALESSYTNSEMNLQILIKEKQQREQGCGYCKVPYKDIIDIILGESEEGEEVHLFINTDGQNLRLYDNLPDNPKTDTLKINYCPMCGRRLTNDTSD